MRPEEYYGDPERIIAAVIGVGTAVAVVMTTTWITRGLERWLWWRI